MCQDKTSAAPKKKRHVPGQGFSEESESFFVELAKQRLGLAQAEEPLRSMSTRSNEGLDEVTKELRLQFEALNKLAELEHRRKLDAADKACRKIVQAQRRKDRKAAKVAKAEKASKRLQSNKASSEKKLSRSAAVIAEPKPKWVQVICWRCKAPMVIHIDWVNPPGLCKECSKFLRETYVPSRKPDRSAKFSYVQVFRGGAPGLGKRS